MLWCFRLFQAVWRRARNNPCSTGCKTGVYKLIAKSYSWRLTTLAVASLLSFWGSDAAALSLGRINVQSALGEPLRAEIDILDINAEEAASLSTKVATPEAFRAAGLDYNAALGALQATLQRRANGRAYIKLSSDRVINDPFVDMILETTWGSGRIVRDYTLLFDPPSLRDANANVPILGQLPAPPTERPATPSTTGQPSQGAARDQAQTLAAKPVVPVAKIPPAPAPTDMPAPPTSPSDVTVKAGDTAGQIAATYKPGSVSLDQMLVALLRANPNAFIQDNVNRIKSGSVLTLPTEEQAAGTPAAQASQIIIAQSQDFNDFRRKFATNAPTAQVTQAGRDVSGKVQATVQDKKPTASTSDKLTLSKGAVQGKSSEDQLAQAKNAKDAASRSAEISKNISDLSKLAAASGAASVGSAAKAPALPVAPPVQIVAPPVPVASQPVSAPGAAAVSAPKKPVSAPVVATEPPPEPSFVDDLLENPLLPAGAAGLIALLAGLALYKARQRKKSSQADSSFTERPEPFSVASGGQSVDTSDNLSTGSSMVYSPSQLDAVDDVDPVAEADVYLAYGRDLQAEEILKDALRSNPQRLAIHHKLLEIYTKRRDAKAFEAIATQAFNLTDGSGTDWEQICDKGLTIDPDNALYLPGGQPFARPSPLTGPAPLDMASGPPTIPVAPGNSDGSATGAGLDLDLDLDLDFSDEPTANLPETPTVTAPPSALPESPTSLATEAQVPAAVEEPASEPEQDFDAMANGLDFSLPTLPDSAEPPASNSPVATGPVAPDKAAPAQENTNLMDFDLGTLSLDLEEEPITQAGSLDPEGQDPLETKLALADEFRAIGDDDGARALIEEVIAEASGDMKLKAQRALSKL
ncbi:MAG: fimbrial protein FimV [Comamonadaceae bacterium]|nr:fimbrial protein FimV [Comamonadaceae bacterium]